MSNYVKKTVNISCKTTDEIAKLVDKYQEWKSKELGVSITKNQAIEFMIKDAASNVK